MRTNKTNPSTNVQDDLRFQALSTLVSRSVLSSYLGQSYNGNRDLYAALGYVGDSELSYNHYYARYARQDIAQRLIDAPVTASWRDVPKLVDGTEGNDDSTTATPFEKAWANLVRNRKLRLFSAFQNVDRFAGLGQYAILVLGYEGDANLSLPVIPSQNKKLAYLRAFGEGSVGIGTLENDPANPRYGMPKYYTIKSTTMPQRDMIRNIHWSRIIHVIDGLTESPTYGIPRLKCVFNRLMDLEKVAGGSAEMYWRGARPGMQFDLDPESMMTPESKDALKTQLDEYENNLRRILRTQGVKINPLAPQVADPEKFIDTQITLISGATGIPKRILTGSERGELASTQDAHNWNTIVHERRTDFCEPNILCPFIERMIEHGVIPETDEGFYTVEWPDLFAPSSKEQAEVSKMRAEALMMYCNSLTGPSIIPPAVFVELIMGFDGSKLKKILDAMKEFQGSEDEAHIFEIMGTDDAAQGGRNPNQEQEEEEEMVGAE